MSFLESLLLIGLGFALATLVGLFVGRVLWKVALRVGARRIQRQVPVTVTELQSDRDRMRAEYAMLSRKMQLAQDSLKMQLAERTAEVMRHRNRVELLNADLGRGATVSSSMDQELQRLRQRVAPLEAELASRTASYQQLRDEQRKKDETIASLTAELAKRDRQIEAFKLEGAIEPPVRSAQDRLSQRIEALTALSKQIADQRERFARDREVLVDLQKAFSATAENIEPEPKLEEIAVNGRELEENLRAAESETDALVREMHDLDAAVNLKVEEFEQVRHDAHPGQVETQLPLQHPEGAPQPRLRTLGNVVTLASRLRPAQKDVSG